MKTMPLLTLLFMFAAAAYAQDSRRAGDVDAKNYGDTNFSIEQVCNMRSMLGASDADTTYSNVQCDKSRNAQKGADQKEIEINSGRVPSSDPQ